MTLLLSTSSVGIGLIFGTFIGIGRLSKRRILSRFAGAYVDFFRGTPLLVQIFLVYYGLPQVLGFPIPRVPAAILALSLNAAAYIAEIVRAGIQSVGRGQVEAALSLGMSQRQTLRWIVLPQAFRRIVPPLGNEFIAMLKDSSLAAVISLEELLRKAQLVYTRTFRPFEMLFGVAVIYLIMTRSFTYLLSRVEARLQLR